MPPLLLPKVLSGPAVDFSLTRYVSENVFRAVLLRDVERCLSGSGVLRMACLSSQHAGRVMDGLVDAARRNGCREFYRLGNYALRFMRGGEIRLLTPPLGRQAVCLLPRGQYLDE